MNNELNNGINKENEFETEEEQKELKKDGNWEEITKKQSLRSKTKSKQLS